MLDPVAVAQKLAFVQKAAVGELMILEPGEGAGGIGRRMAEGG